MFGFKDDSQIAGYRGLMNFAAVCLWEVLSGYKHDWCEGILLIFFEPAIWGRKMLTSKQNKEGLLQLIVLS